MTALFLIIFIEQWQTMKDHFPAIAGVLSAIALIFRAIPFLLFGGGRKMPEAFTVLGRILPPAMIGSLVIYGIRHINIKEPRSVLMELPNLALVSGLHL